MNLEGITLHILTKNLQTALIGGKIAKIFMPTAASLLLVVRNGKDTLSLLADFSGDSPLLYLTDNNPENPDKPPALCMLLRKHLEDGRISKIEQSGLSYLTMMNILNGEATTSPITDAILKNTKPHWPGTYLKAIEFQGNWPTTAEWGVCLVSNHRSFYNRESQSNFFFDTKEIIFPFFV